MIMWQELIVTDSEGTEWGTLDELLANAPANLDNATISGGRITEWPGFFLSAPGEVADSDSPRGDVDWAGFEAARLVASGN